MITLTKSYIWTEIELDARSNNIYKDIHRVCSFLDPSHKFKSAWTRAHYNGIVSLISKHPSKPYIYSFPTGLIHRVTHVLDHYKLEYVVVDEVSHKDDENVSYKLGDEIKIRPYQEEAIQKALEYDRGILCCPTGSGKTIMAGIMISRLKHKSNLFLVHRKELLHQTREKFKQLFPDQEIGIIGCGQCNIQPITVAMVQTIHLALNDPNVTEYGLDYLDEDADMVTVRRAQIVEAIGKAEVIFLDECHNIKNFTIYNSLKVFPCPLHIYGMSATPKDSDPTDLMLWAIFNKIVVNIPPRKLIDEGYLLMPIVRFLDVNCASLQIAVNCTKCKKPTYVLSTYFGDTVSCQYCKRNLTFNYGVAHKSLVDNNHIMHERLAKEVIKHMDDGHTVAVAVSHIELGKNLVKLIPDSVLLTANNSDSERIKIVNKIRDNQIKCVISTIINEGVDFPNLDVICITDGRDDGLYRQRVGRIMRPDLDDPDKKYAYVVDINYQNAAFLDKHSAIRKKIVLDTGYIVI